MVLAPLVLLDPLALRGLLVPKEIRVSKASKALLVTMVLTEPMVLMVAVTYHRTPTQALLP
jgi:hypothetical protein